MAEIFGRASPIDGSAARIVETKAISVAGPDPSSNAQRARAADRIAEGPADRGLRAILDATKANAAGSELSAGRVRAALDRLRADASMQAQAGASPQAAPTRDMVLAALGAFFDADLSKAEDWRVVAEQVAAELDGDARSRRRVQAVWAAAERSR